MWASLTVLSVCLSVFALFVGCTTKMCPICLLGGWVIAETSGIHLCVLQAVVCHRKTSLLWNTTELQVVLIL